VELTKEEQNLIEAGGIKQKAMELVASLGEIFGAKRLVPITSAQIAGVSYKNIGDAGLEFLQDWSKEKVVVQTTLNPAGMPLAGWEELGIKKEFAEKQLEIIEAYRQMGIGITCTCTPYYAGNKPKQGEHVAWSESSSVVYANSVLGAMTNREGGPSALAAAITGRTAEYGMHLPESRKPEITIRVDIPMFGYSDYSILGYWAGKKYDSTVNFEFSATPKEEYLRGLCAGLATSGKVSMFTQGQETKKQKAFTEDSLVDTYQMLHTGEKHDLVAIGCPHLGSDEVANIARTLKGKKVNTPLWLFASKEVAKKAFLKGQADVIRRAGARLIPDTCMVVAPLEELGFKSMLTNSAKAAHYAQTTNNMEVEVAPTEECIKYALKPK